MPALGAFRGTVMPLIPAEMASKPQVRNLYVTALDLERLPVNHTVRDLPARGLDNIPERLPGYVHPARGLFLVYPFKVAEADRLGLVQCQCDYFQIMNRYACGLKERNPRREPDSPAF